MPIGVFSIFRHVIGHVRCSHFHINILVFFVCLSLIVLCYLCDFFSWLCHVCVKKRFLWGCKETIPFRRWIDDVWIIVSWLWKRVRERDKVKKKSHTLSKESFLYTLKGIVSRIDVIFDRSEKRRFFDFCKSPIFRKFTK
jgi:hypothetical protein